MENEIIPTDKKIKVTRDKISQKTIDELNRLHGQLVRSASEVARQVIELGEKLATTKKQVRHGAWTDWVQNNLNFPMRTVQRYMKAAEMKHSLLLDADPSEFMAQIWGNSEPIEDKKVRDGKNDVTSFSDEEDENEDEEGSEKQHGGEGPSFGDKTKHGFLSFRAVTIQLDQQFFLLATIPVEEKLSFIREMQAWLEHKEGILTGGQGAPENEEI